LYRNWVALNTWANIFHNIQDGDPDLPLAIAKVEVAARDVRESQE